MDHCQLLDMPAHCERSAVLQLTNFALSALLSADEHTTVAIGHQAAPEESCSESLPGLHGLHGQISAHGLWYRVKILTSFQALLRQCLDLGAPEWSFSIMVAEVAHNAR